MTPTEIRNSPERSDIPAHLVCDVDIFNLPGAEDDVQLAWRRLQTDLPPIFWTPKNGGHWIATRSEDIKYIQQTYDRFSHNEVLLPKMPLPTRLIPMSLDPPEHTFFRQLVMPLLTPKRVDAMMEIARGVCTDLIDKLAPRGECEFVNEFSTILPVTVFLRMMGLPLDDRTYLVPLANVSSSPDPETRYSANVAMREYLERSIEERRKHPGDDPISSFLNVRRDGELLSHEDVVGLGRVLLGGGLHTVAAAMAFSARFLAGSPAHRRQLIDHPELIPTAVEELLRRHGISNTARLVKEDFEYKDIAFRAGEMIQGPSTLYGLDEDLVEDPTVVDFNRARPIPHAAFGNGPHVCPGNLLARRELRLFLEEWLRKIPDFAIKAGTKPKLASGMLNGVLELQLEWEPIKAA